MMVTMQYTQEQFQEQKIGMLVPTYNNAKTLKAVIDDLLRFTDQIIVVNDGSTDSTQAILAAYNQITIVSYAQNKGKGYALKCGFRSARALGYQYVITIDSDGQHRTSDLHKFLEEVQRYPNTLIIGSRLMEQANKSAKSSFANKFSNFWFRVQTLQNVPDTQSGFRLYPLGSIGNMHLITNRYECELEILVRTAWKGIAIRSIAIDAYYPPIEERVSHFRPFQDFTRISVLNTIVCLVALIYGYPRLLWNKFRD